MKCPKCGSGQSTVLDSREWQGEDQTGIRRRRQCSECGERYSTVELLIEFVNGRNSNAKNTQQVARKAPVLSIRKVKGKQAAKKALFNQALHRARCKAIAIEDEDLAA